eukprot:9602800-Alexandrium_andersonii.AAC.1
MATKATVAMATMRLTNESVQNSCDNQHSTLLAARSIPRRIDKSRLVRHVGSRAEVVELIRGPYRPKQAALGTAHFASWPPCPVRPAARSTVPPPRRL